MTTVGWSPKFIAAVVMAVVGYLTTQELVAFPPWADLLLMVVLVGGGAYVAGPGTVRAGAPRGWKNEEGLALIEVIVLLLAVGFVLHLLDVL